jgi:hypothetical protein
LRSKNSRDGHDLEMVVHKRVILKYVFSIVEKIAQRKEVIKEKIAQKKEVIKELKLIDGKRPRAIQATILLITTSKSIPRLNNSKSTAE